MDARHKTDPLQRGHDEGIIVYRGVFGNTVYPVV